MPDAVALHQLVGAVAGASSSDWRYSGLYSVMGAVAGALINSGQDCTAATRAIVVKSANDIACAVAENLGGTESAFAQRMTRTARGLGMSPYGAGVENKALSDFNIDWQNQQLQRQKPRLLWPFLTKATPPS